MRNPFRYFNSSPEVRPVTASSGNLVKLSPTGHT
jgi:hypothetical protein